VTIRKTAYRRLLGICAVAPGICGIAVFGFYALVDWKELQTAYAHFTSVAQTERNLSVLFVAEAQQNIHRINLFADGVWCLLSALLTAIGLHGLAVTAEK
jgi:hypothetical protein